MADGVGLGVPPVGGIEEVVLAIDGDHRRSLRHVTLPRLVVTKEFDSRSGEFSAVGGQELGEDHRRDTAAVAVGLPQQPERSVVIGHRARVDRTTQVEGAHERLGRRINEGAGRMIGDSDRNALPTRGGVPGRVVKDVGAVDLADRRGPDMVRFGPCGKLRQGVADHAAGTVAVRREHRDIHEQRVGRVGVEVAFVGKQERVGEVAVESRVAITCDTAPRSSGGALALRQRPLVDRRSHRRGRHDWLLRDNRKWGRRAR